MHGWLLPPRSRAPGQTLARRVPAEPPFGEAPEDPQGPQKHAPSLTGARDTSRTRSPPGACAAPRPSLAPRGRRRPGVPSPARPTLATCCRMSEGTRMIITTPSAAHSSPATPSAAAALRPRDRPPMSARPGARGARYGEPGSVERGAAALPAARGFMRHGLRRAPPPDSRGAGAGGQGAGMGRGLGGARPGWAGRGARYGVVIGDRVWGTGQIIPAHFPP